MELVMNSKEEIFSSPNRMPTNIRRYYDWAPRLNAYVIAVRTHTFEWGVHDCTTFAGGAIQAMTGWDPMAEYREHYATEQEGEEALRSIGSGSLYRTLSRKFGRAVPGAHGRKGDVAFYEGRCGVILGPWAMFIGEEGYVYVPINQIPRAFRISTAE